MMLHTKYQDSTQYGFRPGAGHFWPQGHDLNKFGRGLLDDATNQISKL